MTTTYPCLAILSPTALNFQRREPKKSLRRMMTHAVYDTV